MSNVAVVLMTLAYLASMAAMTGYALRLSRKNLKLTRDRNEWRDGYRAMARRATRTETLLEMADARADEMAGERDALIVELGGVREALINAIGDRDLAKDISRGLLEERDALMKEAEAKRDRAQERAN